VLIALGALSDDTIHLRVDSELEGPALAGFRPSSSHRQGSAAVQEMKSYVVAAQASRSHVVVVAVEAAVREVKPVAGLEVRGCEIKRALSGGGCRT
jgi:hypothetical protein